MHTALRLGLPLIKDCDAVYFDVWGWGNTKFTPERPTPKYSIKRPYWDVSGVYADAAGQSGLGHDAAAQCAQSGITDCCLMLFTEGTRLQAAYRTCDSNHARPAICAKQRGAKRGRATKGADCEFCSPT